MRRAEIPPPPERPSGRPQQPAGPPGPPLPPSPAMHGTVLEVRLSRPIADVRGDPMQTVRFTRPPGLGELIGWLDESSPDAIADSLEALPYKPKWVCYVLTQCASVPWASALEIPASDLAALGVALAPFVQGTVAGASPTSPLSPASTGGARETSGA